MVRKLGSPLLPEEEILPVVLSLEITSENILDPEKDVNRRFNIYLQKIDKLLWATKIYFWSATGENSGVLVKVEHDNPAIQPK